MREDKLQFKTKYSESHTSPRYSLASARIGSIDIYHDHPSGRIRLVKYDSWRRDRPIRAAMLGRQLIVGAQLTANKNKHQVFRVPMSTRPLGYDAGVKAGGSFTYGDEQLITDLGRLLGETFKLSEKKLVLAGEIGRMVALTDFIQPGERQLFLVPGAEKLTHGLEKYTDPIEYYEEEIYKTGQKLHANIDSFAKGFREVNEA